ncbi:fatty acid synthase alpha subunit FasA [Aspergillus luchuensis]|uniref:Fatty acid synthase alpha subunit FasA n=1 Tax=Aspergillus kawachii TaxID=1069201 RepID=A0A146G0C3_ASPKA|nr:fatty acid synthase alpha subunit FasA [Aspergillus luchuensis]
MDRSATSGNNGSGRTTNGTHSDLPDLATYQAQWAKIHDDTVRQINEALVWPASSAASRSARGLFPVWAASWGFGERWILATVAVVDLFFSCLE